MPLTLNKPSEAAKLTGLKWVCCECLTVNKPAVVDCDGCGKQRCVQLGMNAYTAKVLSVGINEEGHGL